MLLEIKITYSFFGGKLLGEEGKRSLLLPDHCGLCVFFYFMGHLGSQAHINQQIRRLRNCKGNILQYYFKSDRVSCVCEFSHNENS